MRQAKGTARNDARTTTERNKQRLGGAANKPHSQPSLRPVSAWPVRKPPWRPKVAGYVALLLGPIAGALVAAASFRSMGLLRKAHQTVFYTLLLSVAFLVPFVLAIPADAPIKKIIVLAVEGAGYSVFPSIVREDYVKWRASNPGTKPRNDYASVGWGILGANIYVAIAVLIATFKG